MQESARDDTAEHQFRSSDDGNTGNSGIYSIMTSWIS
jgi:hypothetical protein